MRSPAVKSKGIFGFSIKNKSIIASGDVILQRKITGRPQGSPLRAQAEQPDKLKFAAMGHIPFLYKGPFNAILIKLPLSS